MPLGKLATVSTHLTPQRLEIALYAHVVMSADKAKARNTKLL
jgi:hypothetical protein